MDSMRAGSQEFRACGARQESVWLVALILASPRQRTAERAGSGYGDPIQPPSP